MKESFAWFDKIPKGAKLFAVFLALLMLIGLIALAASGG